jgi:hypothetical protein
MVTNELIIDFSSYGEQSSVMTGKSKGEQYAKDLDLVGNIDLFLKANKIIIKIPKTICCVNPSFLEGFLSQIITNEKDLLLVEHKIFIDSDAIKRCEDDLLETLCRMKRQYMFKNENPNKRVIDYKWSFILLVFLITCYFICKYLILGLLYLL